jgi:hypothetical protein
VISAKSYDRHVEQLFNVLNRVSTALREAGIEYRVIGGIAVYLHVSERDELAARMTRDIDLSVNRSDLARIAEAVLPYGFALRHVAGIDMLVDATKPSARSAVHLFMAGERVRAMDIGPIPELSAPVKTSEGILMVPVADLVRMKLTSFRLKDKVHIQDMQGVGLITAEIEASLTTELRKRLDEVLSGESRSQHPVFPNNRRYRNETTPPLSQLTAGV